ncbi:MAG: alpha/beta hydrolase [Bacteroidetes bacterium]|nr:alpha/beta hydrolase [Bacteroidota bacterium]
MRTLKLLLLIIIFLTGLTAGSFAESSEATSESLVLYSVSNLFNTSFLRAAEPAFGMCTNTVLPSTFNTFYNLSLRVCADGSKATVFHLVTSRPDLVNLHQVILRMKGDPEGASPDQYGSFDYGDKTITSNNRLDWKYQHPTYLAPPLTNLNYRDEVIQVLYAGCLLCELKVRFMTTPVIMVHGLWGDPSTWKELEDSLKKKYVTKDDNFLKNLLTAKVDYSVNQKASADLRANSPYLHSVVYNVINNLAHVGVSCGKVDLVGHSMGGLVARYYMMMYHHKNFVRKLITSNTPHSGSQAANFLLSGLKGAYQARLAINGTGMGFVDKGAVQDIQVGLTGNGVGRLNNSSNLDLQRVPSHAIWTQRVLTYPGDYIPLDSPDFKPWKNEISLINIIAGYRFSNFQQQSLGLLKKINSPAGQALYTALLLSYLPGSAHNLINSIFSWDENDVIVPYASQIGGLSGTRIDFADHQKHIGSVENQEVITLVEGLLRENPNNDDEFANGFNPLSLSFEMTQKSMKVETQSADSIHIFQPSSDTTVQPGDSIILRVAGSPGIMNIMLLAGDENVGYNGQQSFGDSAVFVLKIPDNCPSGFLIRAIAEDSLGNFLSDSVWVDVSYTLLIDSLVSMPQQMTITNCQVADFQIKGAYSDSLLFDLTHQPLLRIKVMDSTIGEVVNKGEIRGLQAGITQVRAVYQGDTIFFPLTVLPEYNVITGDSSFCEGGSGSLIFLENPVEGRSYFLLRNDEPVNAVALSDGDRLTFGYQIMPGLYTVHSYDSIAGCENSYSTLLNLIMIPRPDINLGADTVLTVGDSLTLDAQNPGCSYFWSDGSASPVLTITAGGTYWVSVTNTNGCSFVDSITITDILTGGVFSGTITYKNTLSTPMNGIGIRLIADNVVKYEATTSAGGEYVFDNVTAGTYTIELFIPKSWGGVNAIDALSVLKHTVEIQLLTGLERKAADVNATNGQVNSIDGLLIVKRYVELITSFIIGDWVYDQTEVQIDPGFTKTLNIKVLCSGDANGSYIPPGN